MRRTVTEIVLRLWSALVVLLPLAAAHGALEAAELEVELLADETTDAIYLTGGYDIAQVFLGEAHIPTLGEGPAGDGVYFRGTLAGAPAADGPSSIVFSFDAPDGRVTRTITVAGTEATSDFDSLATEVGSDEIIIERAFVTYASAGVLPGVALSGFRVETFSGSRQVDVAPGGLYAGPLAAPAGESVVVTAEVVLTGAGRYLDVVPTLDGDILTLQTRSLLKSGSQHLEIRVPSAGAIELLTPPSASVGPAGEAEFRVRLLAPTRLDVTSDVGGRDGLVIASADRYRVLAEDGSVVAEVDAAPGRDVPLPAAGLFAGVALAAAFVVRRKRA